MDGNPSICLSASPRTIAALVATLSERRPATIGSEQIRALIRVATSRPEDLGLPFTDWSVAKLHRYCAEKGLLPECTDEWVRRLLRREGLTYQRTKTWKKSNDPLFEEKKGASSTSMRKHRRTGL